MVMVVFACLPQGGSVTDADPDMQRSDLQERQHPAAIFIPAPLTAKAMFMYCQVLNYAL